VERVDGMSSGRRKPRKPRKQVVVGNKIQNFMLISKLLICLSDKMLLHKIKIKNCFVKGQNLAK
jgi:hypothetical protein